MEKSKRYWFVVGCYLSLDDAPSVERVVRAMEQFTRGGTLMLVEYLNVDIVKKIGEPEGQGYFVGTSGCRYGVYVLPLPPVPRPISKGQSDMLHAPAGWGGAVLGRFHYWDIPPSVLERIRPGPQTQHKPLHSPGLPP